MKYGFKKKNEIEKAIPVDAIQISQREKKKFMKELKLGDKQIKKALKGLFQSLVLIACFKSRYINPV